MLRRLHAATASIWWTWACVVMFGSGAVQLVVPALRWAPPLGFGLSTLYPAMLLAGALAYAGRDVPLWLAPGAFALGALRGVALVAGMPQLAHGAALLLEPTLCFAAAAVMGLAMRSGVRTPSERAVAPALVAIGCLDAATAVTMLRDGVLSPALVMTWLVAGPAVLAMQLTAWAHRVRSDMVRARELLEQQLAEQAERYRTVSALSSDYSFSYRVGPGGHLQREWITDSFARITGHPPELMEGRGWHELVHPDDRSRVEQELEELTAGKRDTLEFRFVNPEGEERWIELHIALRELAQDGSVRLVGAARNVTDSVLARWERHRIEEKLREAQRLESLGRLAGGIAHDFNNALTVILGNTRLVEGDLGSDHPGRQRLARIRAAAEYAADLTEQILAYSGKAAVDMVSVDVSAMVKETLGLLRASVGSNISIETHLPAGLPPVAGDLTQLRQVLVNLVTNASEAMDGAAGLIRVRTGARGVGEGELGECLGDPAAEPGHYVTLEVADSGPGLPRTEHGRIFEPFYSTKAEGRGLGLAAVHGIICAHRGAIRVESDPGRGATIEVLLPRGAGVAQPKAVVRAAAVRGHGRVLVVDDDEAVLEVAGAFLARAGFEVETAAGGREALRILQDSAGAVDAVVLDLVMPGLSGEATFLELREHHPDLPVVLASGYDREQAAQRFSARGVSDFVRKPFEADALAGSVRRALVDRGRLAG